MHATGLDLNLNHSALWNIARLADGLKSTASDLCSSLSLAARIQLGKLREQDLTNPTRYYSVMHLKNAALSMLVGMSFITLLRYVYESQGCYDEENGFLYQDPSCYHWGNLVLSLECFAVFVTMMAHVFPRQVANHINSNRDNPEIDLLTSSAADKDPLLFLRPTSDFTGGFSKGKTRGPILKSLSAHHSIVNHLIRNVQDINREFKEAGKIQKPRRVWLGGHGCPTGMALSSSRYKSERLDSNSITQIDWDALDPNAVIFLDSCSTGKSLPDGKPNFADHVRVAAGPNRRVIAPTIDSNDTQLRLLDAATFSIGFEMEDGTNITYEPSYEEAFEKVTRAK